MKFFRRTGYLHLSTTFWFFKLVSSSSPICESSLPMASSLALKRLLSANLINRSLRPVGSPTSSASSCFTATDAPSLDPGRRSDAPIAGRRDFHGSPGLNITDVSSPFLSRSLSQMINIMHSPIASGINYYDGDAKGTPNNMHFSKGMSTMIIHGGNKKSSEEEEKENGRQFSTVAAVPDEESHQKKSLRPLSPHLPIYKPQLSSTTSILNRISAIILTSTILGSYVYVKVGTVAFTYPNFYEFCYYSTKIVPIALEISALALVYHVYAGIGHLVADFSGKLSMWKKH